MTLMLLSGTYKASMTANTTAPRHRRPTRCPNVQTIAIGMTAMDQSSTAFESGVGFS
jgi:hypothetical protein